MKLRSLLFVTSTLLCSVSFAQNSTTAPAAAQSPSTKPVAVAVAGSVTALCRDGTTFSGDSKSGACSGHKGVKTWTSDKASKSGDSSNSKAVSQKAPAPMATAAAGGVVGKVWVNTKSNT